MILIYFFVWVSSSDVAPKYLESKNCIRPDAGSASLLFGLPEWVPRGVFTLMSLTHVGRTCSCATRVCHQLRGGARWACRAGVSDAIGLCFGARQKPFRQFAPWFELFNWSDGGVDVVVEHQRYGAGISCNHIWDYYAHRPRVTNTTLHPKWPYDGVLPNSKSIYLRWSFFGSSQSPPDHQAELGSPSDSCGALSDNYGAP